MASSRMVQTNDGLGRRPLLFDSAGAARFDQLIEGHDVGPEPFRAQTLDGYQLNVFPQTVERPYSGS